MSLHVFVKSRLFFGRLFFVEAFCFMWREGRTGRENSYFNMIFAEWRLSAFIAVCWNINSNFLFHKWWIAFPHKTRRHSNEIMIRRWCIVTFRIRSRIVFTRWRWSRLVVLLLLPLLLLLTCHVIPGLLNRKLGFKRVICIFLFKCFIWRMNSWLINWIARISFDVHIRFSR